VRSGNAVILVDSKNNIERLRQVLREIDQDTTVYRTFSLDHASAAEVAKLVSNLAQEISEEGGRQTRVSVVPIEASNSILVRAEPAVVARLAGVVAELDRIGEVHSDLSVIALDHADAEELTPLLREIAQSQPTAPGAGAPAPGVNDRAIISYHLPTNSVIVSGDARVQQTVRSVIAQLDVRRAQVLVEAIIVEVTDNKARELGIQYFISGDGSKNSRIPFSATNFSSAQPNILAAAGAFLLDDERFQSDAIRDAALSSLLGINGLLLGGAGNFGDNGVFAAVLTALQEDDESRILSFPSVLTLDNEPATLSVGQEIPITTGEAVGDDFANAFRTISRKEVGVILEVTPKINDGGTVTLKIRQESSSVAGQIISTSTDLITNTRIIETTALVDDQDVLVLGGLVDQEEVAFQSKVPLLGDIPLAGNLFKTSGKSRGQRNLMVFIRPTIIRDKDSARAATNKKLDYIRAREIMSARQPVSELDRLIEQVTGMDRIETSE
jgi:general secretion pathway protein D